MRFSGGSDGKAMRETCNKGDLGLIPGLGRSPEEGNGNPLQCSCLENPRDRGAWWAAVYGVAQSRTRLSDFTFTFHFHALEKEMATHSSVLAWRIPGIGEPGELPSMGSHRVGHDWSDLAAAAAAACSIYKKRSLSFLPSLDSWDLKYCLYIDARDHWINQEKSTTNRSLYTEYIVVDDKWRSFRKLQWKVTQQARVWF